MCLKGRLPAVLWPVLWEYSFDLLGSVQGLYPKVWLRLVWKGPDHFLRHRGHVPEASLSKACFPPAGTVGAVPVAHASFGESHGYVFLKLIYLF